MLISWLIFWDLPIVTVWFFILHTILSLHFIFFLVAFSSSNNYRLLIFNKYLSNIIFQMFKFSFCFTLWTIISFHSSFYLCLLFIEYFLNIFSPSSSHISENVSIIARVCNVCFGDWMETMKSETRGDETYFFKYHLRHFLQAFSLVNSSFHIPNESAFSFTYFSIGYSFCIISSSSSPRFMHHESKSP